MYLTLFLLGHIPPETRIFCIIDVAERYLLQGTPDDPVLSCGQSGFVLVSNPSNSGHPGV
jgi:hypothetical protein